MRCPKCYLDNPDTQHFCGDCGTRLFSPQDLPQSNTLTLNAPQERFAPGFVFEGRYRIVRELGKGGMGRVFLARDMKLERDVALKFIGAAVQADNTIRERFFREAKAAASLDHPFICKIYDTGEIEGDVFIAMEYVEGKNLREETEQKPLPLKDVVQLISEVSEALAKAHEKGIVHRDLKPENIMLTPQGHAKVMDFGIAKITSFDEAPISKTLTKEFITKDGTIVGTLAYMSPEQACGDIVDRRSDIYSLGAVFFELLSGGPPFLRPTAAETLSAILKDPTPPLTSIPKKLSPAVNRILRRLLAKDPKARFQDISELISETKNIQKEMVAVSLPLFRRLSIAIPVTASLLVVLLSVVWFAWLKDRLFIKKAPEPVSVLVADFQNNTGDSIFEGTTEEALCIGLEGAPFINIYKRSNAKKLIHELNPQGSKELYIDNAQLIARRELIKVVIGGSIKSGGQEYMISIQAIAPINSKVISECSTEFKNKSELLGAIDRLAYRIRSDLGDIPTDPAQKHLVETFTTRSIEAMKAYTEAQELQSQGEDKEAIEAYQRAIEKDPDFGRAYSGIAISYFYSGQPDKYSENMQKALARLDRMTEREKYRTRGVDFLFARNYKKAIDEFRRLTEEFPADHIGHANLAIAYWGTRDYKQAVKSAKDSLELNPQDVISLRNLAQYALDMGDFSLAEESAKRAIEINPKFEETYKYLADVQTAGGRFEEAEQTWQKCVNDQNRAEPGLLSLALYESRLSAAKQLAENNIGYYLSLKSPYGFAWAAQTRVKLAGVLIRQNQQAQALQELTLAMANLGESEFYNVAQIYLKAHELNKAASLAQRIEKSTNPLNKGLSKIIEAEINTAMEKDIEARSDLDESIKILEEEISSDDRWRYRFYLGYAYLKNDALAEAHSEFELCLKRRGEAFDFAADLDEIALVYFYLGEVQEKLKSPAASESYRQFLDIKRRSDGDTMVDEAKRRLALLEKQQVQ